MQGTYEKYHLLSSLGTWDKNFCHQSPATRLPLPSPSPSLPFLKGKEEAERGVQTGSLEQLLLPLPASLFLPPETTGKERRKEGESTVASSITTLTLVNWQLGHPLPSRTHSLIIGAYWLALKTSCTQINEPVGLRISDLVWDLAISVGQIITATIFTPTKQATETPHTRCLNNSLKQLRNAVSPCQNYNDL